MEPSRQSLLHEQSGKKGTADSVMTHEPVLPVAFIFCAPSIFYIPNPFFYIPNPFICLF